MISQFSINLHYTTRKWVMPSALVLCIMYLLFHYFPVINKNTELNEDDQKFLDYFSSYISEMLFIEVLASTGSCSAGTNYRIFAKKLGLYEITNIESDSVEEYELCKCEDLLPLLTSSLYDKNLEGIKQILITNRLEVLSLNFFKYYLRYWFRTSVYIDLVGDIMSTTGVLASIYYGGSPNSAYIFNGCDERSLNQQTLIKTLKIYQKSFDKFYKYSNNNILIPKGFSRDETIIRRALILKRFFLVYQIIGSSEDMVKAFFNPHSKLKLDPCTVIGYITRVNLERLKENMKSIQTTNLQTIMYYIEIIDKALTERNYTEIINKHVLEYQCSDSSVLHSLIYEYRKNKRIDALSITQYSKNVLEKCKLFIQETNKKETDS